MKLKPRHLEEELRYCSGRAKRTTRGALQFWHFESTGQEPAHGEGEPYYHDLRRGKMDHCLSVTGMADSYGNEGAEPLIGDWFGWCYINLAFADCFIEELKSALQHRGWRVDLMDTSGGLTPDEKQEVRDRITKNEQTLRRVILGQEEHPICTM